MVEGNIEKIELFFLPLYSPVLHPDEYLNRDLKQAISSKTPARNGKQLYNEVLSQMKSIQKSPEKIKSYFKNKNVRYAI